MQGDSHPDVTAIVQCGNCSCNWMRLSVGPLKSVGFGCSLPCSQVITKSLQNVGVPNRSSICWDQLLFFPRRMFLLELLTSQTLHKTIFLLLAFLIPFPSTFTAVLVSRTWLLETISNKEDPAFSEGFRFWLVLPNR